MSLFPDMQTVIQFGPFKVTWYATLIITGALCAYVLSQKTVKKWGYPSELFEDYIFPVMLIGILGARLYYVIFQWDYYSQNPMEIFMIWHGGLAIYGGLIAGVIYSIYYFKKRKIDCLRMADCIAPQILLGQAFGRWGNFMNQEAFGKVVPESFYDHFPTFIKNQMYIAGQYRTPTFLYESTIDFLGFLFIYFIFRKKFYKRKGDCAFMYMIWYGVGRFIVEGMRTDSLMLGTFRISQIVSIILILIGILGLSGIFHKLFHWYKKPGVLFDLDGTLIDSKDLIFETFRRVFKEEKPGYELSEEELYSFFGPPLEESFSKYFKEDEIERIIEKYQTINRRIHDEYVKPMPYVKEVLESLKKEGYEMAVVSNKRHSVVELGLKHCRLDSYFNVVLGKEDLQETKPSAFGLLEACRLLHTSHDDVIYVGDNDTDIQAAKNMAAYSVGFVQDAIQKDKVEAQHPCKIISDLRELISLCKEERSWSDNTIW